MLLESIDYPKIYPHESYAIRTPALRWRPLLHALLFK
jgi:hypothetical protein